MSKSVNDNEERWQSNPRPLKFVRVRLYGIDHARYIKELFEDEQTNLLEDLGKARSQGLPENGPAISELRTNLRFLSNALQDVNSGMVELVGPAPED